MSAPSADSRLLPSRCGRRSAALTYCYTTLSLLHDAQFLESERSTAELYGHATVDEAIQPAEESGVGTLVLFHHGPNRTDDELDAIARDRVTPVDVVVGREGSIMEVSARRLVSW